MKGVVISTPSAISISQIPNSFYLSSAAFERRRKISFRRTYTLFLTITTKAGEILFRCPDPPSLTTAAATPSPTAYDVLTRVS